MTGIIEMYEKFYGLTTRPFTMQPDPYFLYWGHTHSLAYSMLEYGILNEAGFTVITGEIGSGKTRCCASSCTALTSVYRWPDLEHHDGAG